MIRRAAAEALGTSLLVAAVVGSGIMAERLASGNEALALLANSLATGAALLAIVTALAPISGAHLNPAVTLAAALRRAHPWRETPAYVAAQLGGAFVGVALAHAMFGEPIFEASTRVRAGLGQGLSEGVAAFGLVLVVSSRSPPAAIAAYVAGAYWFTASTAFANPAVTLARAATDTFTGIRPADVPAFVVAQLAGAAAAALVWKALAPPRASAWTS